MLVVAVARFAAVVVGGWKPAYGDFAATLPGGYAERLNPTLWNSPDLSQSWAFHRAIYIHGPTQFLTLFPIVFLDSYAAISRLLLVVYAVVIGAAVFVLWRIARALEPRTSPVAVVSAVLLFFPLLQAYSQREFEVVIVLATALLVLAALRDRQSLAGALAAYIAWFKYLPIALAGYLALRRWTRSILWFVLASAAWLALAHALFGLPRFVYHTRDDDIPIFRAAFGGNPLVAGRGDVCRAIQPVYDPAALTQVSVRWALCGFANRGIGLPVLPVYLLILTAAAGVFVYGFVRLERALPANADRERWRRAFELGIVSTVASTFLFAHYYYLSVLAVPMIVLLARLRARPSRMRWAMWLLTYACLSPFVVPISAIDRVLHIDSWRWYMQHSIYFFGVMLLVSWLEYEYVALGAVE